MSWFWGVVYDMDPISFFYEWISNFPNTIYWRDCLFFVVYSWHPYWGSVDHILGLFLTCSLPLVYYVFLWQYHNVVITLALWYILKSGSVVPPVFFFFKVVLAIWDLLWFHMNFKIVFLFCKKEMPLEFW